MAEARPLIQLEQEVRFAVVMYGGVSLAIYINGVAQELFRLVRATAPEKPVPSDEEAPVESDERVYFADAGARAEGGRPVLRPSEQVYRELGQRLGIGGLEPKREQREGEQPPPVRTRFVVDIVSGTSAGGINGVLLGKAIAEQQDFGVSEQLWLKVADIAALLRDKPSWKDLPRGGKDPESLLNGHRLFWEALNALQDMEGTEELPDDKFRPAYAEQLELNVTATDLLGLPRPVRLRPECFVNENVHRKVFRFEYGLPETLGEKLSDFENGMNPLLAFAARATSSFPFAFEPLTLGDVEFMTKAMPDPKPWFEGYTGIDPRNVFFADGGYLDNKPFSYATQALRRRRADVPVNRKLVYIEPDPAPDVTERPATPPPRPDVYRNVMDAMGGLPRFEPIRQDIADVTDRNAAVRRLRDLEQRAVKAADEPAAQVPEAVREAYLSLRMRVVLDALAGVAARLRDWDDDDRRAIAVREKLSEWVDTKTRDELLRQLDTPFLHRRANFLHDRASELLREGEADAVAVQTFKRALNKAFEPLRSAGRAPRARDLRKTLDQEQRTRFGAVQTAAGALPDGLEEYVAAVAAFLDAPLRAARDGIARALDALAQASPAGGRLKGYDDRFELVDGIVLPLAHPDLGEANAVELWRVSPRDSTGAVPTHEDLAPNPPNKLAGLRLHHFGAFLDEGYRENDVLWGRLDGAEAIVNAVLRDDKDKAAREQFRIAAQAAILREAMPKRLEPALREELGRPQSPANDEALLKAFLERYTAPGEIEAARKEALARRAIKITSKVLRMRAKERKIPKLPLALLGSAGPGLVRVVGAWRRIRRR